MWALSNIAGESFYDFRHLILDAGILKVVGDQFCRTNKKPSYYKTAAWLFYNLMKKVTPPFDKVNFVLFLDTIYLDFWSYEHSYTITRIPR